MESKQTGMRLKELRKKSRLTQEQLAKFLNVDQSMVTKLENGTRCMTITMMDRVCGLFGCTEEYLAGESEEYIPLYFAFRSSSIETEDLESMAAVNKIVMNLRYMNEIAGEKQNENR